MSTFFVPRAPMPEAGTMDSGFKTKSPDLATLVPKELGGEAELLAYPTATAAAFAAFGAGMAGHAFGVWMSAVSNSLEAAQKFSALAFASLEGNAPADKTQASPDTVAAGTRAEATETVIRLALRSKRAEKPAERGSAVNATPVSAVATVTAPANADDLKAISGIGPKLEKVLKDLGYRTYVQIAALGESDIAKLDDELGFNGRIARDDWRGQAARLAKPSSR